MAWDERKLDAVKSLAKQKSLERESMLKRSASNIRGQGQRPFEGSIGYSINSLKELGVTDGIRLKTNDALELAEKFLGPEYKNLGKGRFVSRDGLRQVRMGDSDILGKHGGGPHMNFEILEPNVLNEGKMALIENYHVFLED